MDQPWAVYHSRGRSTGSAGSWVCAWVCAVLNTCFTMELSSTSEVSSQWHSGL